jgi:hypothetical protein
VNENEVQAEPLRIEEGTRKITMRENMRPHRIALLNTLTKSRSLHRRFHIQWHAFHANAGVELVALPDIETVHWKVPGYGNRFHLATLLSSEFITTGIGHLKICIPCESEHKLVFVSPSGDTLHQENPRDENLLIQELGWSGPIVNGMPLRPLEAHVETMGNTITLKILLF